MREIEIRDAQHAWSRFVEEAASGVEVVITRAGQPVAKLVPLEKPPAIRLGVLKGQIEVPDDFDVPLPDGTFARP